MAPNIPITKEDKETIVLMLGHQPNISAVARLMGLHPTSVYRAKKNDPEFSEEIDKAMEIGYDGLEEEAIRRGRDGVQEPVFFQGEDTGLRVTRYSDALLKELLRAYRPRKFNPGLKLGVEEGEKVILTINLGTSSQE